MAIQQINLGSMPLGTGGDTQRAANEKINQNFSNQDHAASRLVGTKRGNVVEMTDGVAGTGIGSAGIPFIKNATSLEDMFSKLDVTKFVYLLSGSTLPTNLLPVNEYSMGIGLMGGGDKALFLISTDGSRAGYLTRTSGGAITTATFYTTKNTTKDSNGFLKGSSPIVDLYDNKIELNGDATTQGIEFIKNGTGDYTLKTKTGLRSDNTWQIELPQDNNKNPLFAVDIDAQEDGIINIKCYKRIFSMDTFLFGPDFNEPMNILEGRFISVRLNDNPEEQLDEPIE